MKKSLVCFDLDGTIVDSRMDIANAVNHALVSLGAPALTEPQITSMVGHGLKKTVELASSADGDKIDMKMALQLTIDYYFEHPVVQTTLYDGVEASLKYLNENDFVVALFTNKLQPISEKILDIFKIRRYFSYVIGAESGFEMKPSPTPIEFMLSDSGCTREGSFMIGDSSVDIMTGKNAGIKTCLVTYGYGHKGELEPDLTCASMRELMEKIG